MASSKRNAPPRQPALPPLHELEAEVMEELWSQEEATVRAVMDALNKYFGGQSDSSTLERL